VEALDSGFLHILILAEPDAKEPVGQVVGMLAETEEELKKIQDESGVVAAPAAAKGQKDAPAEAPARKTGKAKGGRVRISPVARKMAEEHNLDLDTIDGTGPDGRITKKDVETAVENKKAGVPAEPQADAVPPQQEYEGNKVKATISLKSGMRKAIASHMKQSLDISAQLTTMGEIDMTEVIKLRAELLKDEEILGTRITYTDIFVKAVTAALKYHPIINSSLIDNEILLWEDAHIGVAVALESKDGLGGGLIVPVIKHTARKFLVEISKELKDLIKNAREGKLLPDDLTGGTFTITNLGGAGGAYGYGTPIINQPESAILGTGPITERAVVKDGEIVIRPILTYSFTFDHRVIDGAPAAAFMAHLTRLLENPVLMI